MSASLSPTARLGAYVSDMARRPLADDVATKAASCLLDALGLAVVAHDERTAAAARAITPRAADGPARLWATGARANLADAVLANGVAVHAHFQDDTDHESWTHPGSLVVPVAAGLAEANDGPLDTALRSIVAGYTAIRWLGYDEEVSRGLIGRGIRTSPTLGTLAAAAAGACALALDAEAATRAIGIASSITGGTLEPVRCGSDEWRVQNGRAAQGGLIAALLAREGVVGAPDGLDGPRGLSAALAGRAAPPARWAEPPDPAFILEVMAKPFATLGDNMPAVMAAQLLNQDGIAPTAIRRLSVTLWRPYTDYPGTGFKGPFVRTVQTQASTAFAVSSMLAYGRLDYAMGIENRDDPRILDLVAKVTVVPHDGPPLASEIEAELEDGRIVRRSADEAPRTLILPDPARTAAVLDERLAAAGHPAGLGRDIAAEVYASALSDRALKVRGLLDRIAIPQ